MTDRDRQSLLDMVQSSQLIDCYLTGKTQANLEADQILQDAVIRRLEIVGEAARRLSEDALNELNHINWSQIIGMRNIIAHQYDRLDLDFVWSAATEALPQLIQQITPYL